MLGETGFLLSSTTCPSSSPIPSPLLSTPVTTMKAIYKEMPKAGEIKVVIDEKAPVPRPGRGRVLVEVRSCALSSYTDTAVKEVLTNRDMLLSRTNGSGPSSPRSGNGSPRMSPLMVRKRRGSGSNSGSPARGEPLRCPVGHSFAGVVRQVGAEVYTLEEGDEVVGIIPLDYGMSGCAQYVAVHEFDVVRKPEEVDWVDAAAGVGEAVRAYTALHYLGKMSAGDTVLVMDGSSSLGSVCIQLALHWGARVITTSAPPNVTLTNMNTITTTTTTTTTANMNATNGNIDTNITSITNSIKDTNLTSVSHVNKMDSNISSSTNTNQKTLNTNTNFPSSNNNSNPAMNGHNISGSDTSLTGTINTSAKATNINALNKNSNTLSTGTSANTATSTSPKVVTKDRSCIPNTNTNPNSIPNNERANVSITNPNSSRGSINNAITNALSDRTNVGSLNNSGAGTPFSGSPQHQSPRHGPVSLRGLGMGLADGIKWEGFMERRGSSFDDTSSLADDEDVFSLTDTNSLCVLEANNAGLKSQVLLETSGLGVDIVIDQGSTTLSKKESLNQQNLGVGSGAVDPSLHELLSCLSVGGRFITTRHNLQLDPPHSRLLFSRCASVGFLFEQAWVLSSYHQGRYQHILMDVMEKVASNIIKPLVHKRVQFSEVEEALKEGEKTGYRGGSIVLTM